MRSALRAGMAVFNTGSYHEAHDAWEDRWLELESGTADEQLLHGLIQYTAAIHHAHTRNWEGTVGLAKSGLAYLVELPDSYRGVDLPPIRAVLATLESDPEWIERSSVPPMIHEGEAITGDVLELDSAAIAAAILAAARSEEDRQIVESVIEYAKRDRRQGRTERPFEPLIYAFLRPDADYSILLERMRALVARRSGRESAVDDLFDQNVDG